MVERFGVQSSMVIAFGGDMFEVGGLRPEHSDFQPPTSSLQLHSLTQNPEPRTLKL